MLSDEGVWVCPECGAMNWDQPDLRELECEVCEAVCVWTDADWQPVASEPNERDTGEGCGPTGNRPIR